MKVSRLLLAGLSLLLLGAFPLLAQGGRDGATQSRVSDIKDFDSLSVSAGIQVTLKQAKQYSIKLSGDEAALERLIVRKQRDTLVLGFKPGLGLGMNRVQVDIAMPSLQAIELSGGSGLRIDFDASATKRLAIALSGGSRLEGLLLAGALAVELSGGSRMAVEGYGESIAAEVNGGSRFDCADWAVGKAVIELAGGAYACLAIQDKLVVNASGGSRLEYRGKPEVVSKLSGGSQASALAKD